MASAISDALAAYIQQFIVITHDFLGTIQIRGVGDSDPHFAAGYAHTASNARCAQLAIDVVSNDVETLRNRGLHIDLKQEVHPAPQIKPETHRLQPGSPQPVRHSRR